MAASLSLEDAVSACREPIQNLRRLKKKQREKRKSSDDFENIDHNDTTVAL